MHSLPFFAQYSYRRIYLAILAMLLAAPLACADHRGAFGVLADPAANVCDTYAFIDPNDPSKAVLAMTVNGDNLPGLNSIFDPECLYQFKIDNTGDAVEDLVLQVVFNKPAEEPFGPTQFFTVYGPYKPASKGATNSVKKSAAVVSGPITNIPVTDPNAPLSTFTTGSTGIKVFCGLRDDPFFCDEIYFRNIIRGTVVAPNPPNTTPFRSFPMLDFEANLNCSAIVIELPSEMLAGPLVDGTGHKLINVWATTSLPATITRAVTGKNGKPAKGHESFSKTYVQFDRAANPWVSTFLISNTNKETFRFGQPRNDAAVHSDDAKTHIHSWQIDPTTPTALAATGTVLGLRFPDVLRLDLTSTSGYTNNNGRRPQDNVIGYDLGLMSAGAINNSGVNANDVPFLAQFPFFQVPHTPRENPPQRD